MKSIKITMAAITALVLLSIIGCASKPKARIVELENKGTVYKIDTPGWVTTYIKDGISGVQRDYKDKYCFIGEETGVNRQFVLAWAESFSSQQRIGAMVRTNIASTLQAEVNARAQSVGGANSASAAGAGSGEYRQEISNVLTVIINTPYTGAQRESDWWSLQRRYDPDQKDVFSDEYKAWVLYTIPKSQLNTQVAHALETATKKDSVLYDITIQLAKKILLNGMDNLGEENLPPPATPPARVPVVGPSGNIAIRNISNGAGNIMSMVKIYKGHEAIGTPLVVYQNPVSGIQQADWDLPEGPYIVEVFLNNSLVASGTKTVDVTGGSRFFADFTDGILNSFIKR